METLALGPKALMYVCGYTRFSVHILLKKNAGVKEGCYPPPPPGKKIKFVGKKIKSIGKAEGEERAGEAKFLFFS